METTKDFRRFPEPVGYFEFARIVTKGRYPMLSRLQMEWLGTCHDGYIFNPFNWVYREHEVWGRLNRDQIALLLAPYWKGAGLTRE